MPLTCGCDHEPEPGMKMHYPGEDFERLGTSKRKRCWSCKRLISINDFVVRFSRVKIPSHVVEIAIYGEDGEIPIAPRYLCEQCGEIYLNLSAVGFDCITPYENMTELLKQYQNTYLEQDLEMG